MTPNGQDALTRALAQELEFASTRNIFNLLLRPTIKESLSDWQAFFSFVYMTLRRTTPKTPLPCETVFIPKATFPPPPTRPPLARQSTRFRSTAASSEQNRRASRAAQTHF